jgi:cell division septum initiation protein DivIVA
MDSSMDVTPSELRDSDIREAFRGYARDDVDELLERAAAALEHLTERVQQMSGRVSDAESNAHRTRENEDIIQRTLIMAQKAADDAVAEAETRARSIMQDAEMKAAAVMNEAETKAVATAEAERQRVEAEVRDLATRREVLNQDVESLERYQDEARSRVRRVFEEELVGLERLDAADRARPEMHDVAVPEREEAVVRQENTWSANAQTAAIEAVEPLPAPDVAREGVAFDDPELPPDWTSGPVRIAGREEGAGREQAGLYDFVEPDEPVEAEVLDDDAFFATLREAVNDEAPLSSREDEGGDFFDQDRTDPPKKRRRRKG